MSAILTDLRITDLRITARRDNRAVEIAKLDALRAGTRVACTISDGRRRSKELRRIASHLSAAWLDSECREGADRLLRAIDDVVLRAGLIADLARMVRP